MPFLNITEYNHAVGDAFGRSVQAGEEPAIAYQEITVTGASGQSNVFAETTQLVRLHCDEPCRIRFGTNPTALATDTRLPANATEYFGVPIGLGFRLAVISG